MADFCQRRRLISVSLTLALMLNLFLSVAILAQATQPQRPPNPPPPERLPPNSTTAPRNPRNEAQQSTQPQSQQQQQQQQTDPNAPRPISPRPPTQQPNLPSDTTTTQPGTTPTQPGNPAAPATGIQPGVPATPGQNVGVTGGVAPAQLPQEPPPIAPDFRAPLRPLPSAERVGVDVTAQTPLTLEEAIIMALQNNNDIDAARAEVQMAGFGLQAARGIYDPRITSENFYERSVTPTASTLGGGPNGAVTQSTLTGSARLAGFTPLAGGSYQLDFSSNRLTTNNQFVALNPQFPSALTFSYVQPLWRGLRLDDNRRQIQIARKNLSLTDAQFRQQAIETITRVAQAYWDLAFSLRNLQVQIDAVRQARLQVESNQRQVEQGVLAPIDIVAANTQVTTFEQNVYTAQEAVTRAENTLKALLLPDRRAPLWSQALLPATPVNIEPPTIALATAVTSALTNRPEIAQLQATAEINEINSRYFHDQTKPQIDLVSTYSSAGLAGTLVANRPNPLAAGFVSITDRLNALSALAGLPLLPPVSTGTGTIPDVLVGGYNQSLSNLFGQNYPTTRVGVRIGLPLGNRTAEANLGRSLAESTRIRDQRAQTEQLIEADVRNTMQAMRSAQARLAAAAAARTSSEQLYNSEQRRLAAGTSTVFLVLQRQTELIAARGRELQAQTDLNKAIAEFQRATGSTFQAHNVVVRSDLARK
ncbi:MAG: TolC family protein [Blastocatellia bacterium]